MALIVYNLGGTSGTLDTAQGLDSADARYLMRYLSELNGARLALVQAKTLGGHALDAVATLNAIDARMGQISAVLP